MQPSKSLANTTQVLSKIFFLLSRLLSRHNICTTALQIPIKAALADRKKVVKTGSISMGRGRCMGRGSAGASCRGMGRGSARVRLRGMGRSSVGAKLRGMGKDSIGASLRGMGRGSAGVRLWGMGRGSAGTRMRGMGRGNDAKTALRVIKKSK